MLRIATYEDLPIVSRMAESFISNSPYRGHFDMGMVDGVLSKLITAEDPRDGVVLLHGDQGMLAGMASPFIYGPHYMATELGWWVEPEARKTGIGKELILAFEEWARRVGCTLITMISLDDRVSEYYEKNNYQLTERAYMKELQWPQ